MNYKIFVIVCFLSFSIVLEKSALASDADKQQLKSTLQQISSFQADFTQTIVNEIGEELQQAEGQITIGKPNKMRWHVVSPDENLSVADGTALYNLDPFVEQVTILDQSQVIQNNPLALLLNDGDDKWNEVLVEKEDTIYTITPNNPDSSIVELTMHFYQQQLAGITTKDLQGQQNIISFSNIRINPMLSHDLFTLDIPTGYAIDDQR